MSWGTYYKHEGYLSRTGKGDIDDEIKACNETIDSIFMKLGMLCAATPPATVPDSEGNSMLYHEWLQDQLQHMRIVLEDAISLRTRCYDCKDAMTENPENVTEG